MTDAFTDELFSLPEMVIVRYPISKLLVDVERFLDDAEESMRRMGMGVIYTRTAYQKTLRRPLESHEVRNLVSEYYEPHHHKLFAEVNNELQKCGKALIVLSQFSKSAFTLRYGPVSSKTGFLYWHVHGKHHAGGTGICLDGDPVLLRLVAALYLLFQGSMSFLAGT